MSKAVKKTLLFAGLTVATFLIICVAAMLFTGCVKTPPAASPSPARPSADVSEPAQAESPSPSPSEPDASEPPAEAEALLDLDGDGADDYSITLGERNYVCTRTESGAVRYEDAALALASDKPAKLYIELSLTPKTKAEKLAPGFADAYIDASDTEYAGVGPVGASKLRGEQIRAQSETENLSAWLVDTERGVLAIVLVYSPDVGNAAFDAAFELINSIEVK